MCIGENYLRYFRCAYCGSIVRDTKPDRAEHPCEKTDTGYTRLRQSHRNSTECSIKKELFEAMVREQDHNESLMHAHESRRCCKVM